MNISYVFNIEKKHNITMWFSLFPGPNNCGSRAKTSAKTSTVR